MTNDAVDGSAGVKAIVIDTDGAVKQVVLRGYTDLRDHIHGFLAGFGPWGVGDWYGYCDEEGKLKGLAINRVATDLANRLGRWSAGVDMLAGPVVFVGAADGDGNDTDVPDYIVDLVVR